MNIQNPYIELIEKDLNAGVGNNAPPLNQYTFDSTEYHASGFYEQYQTYSTAINGFLLILWILFSGYLLLKEADYKIRYERKLIESYVKYSKRFYWSIAALTVIIILAYLDSDPLAVFLFIIIAPLVYYFIEKKQALFQIRNKFLRNILLGIFSWALFVVLRTTVQFEFLGVYFSKWDEDYFLLNLLAPPIIGLLFFKLFEVKSKIRK